MKQRFGKLSPWWFSWSIICLITGMVLIRIFVKEYETYSMTGLIGSIFLIVVVLVGTMNCIMRALPRWSYLQLDENGFEIKFGRGTMAKPWQECGRFFLLDMKSLIPFRKKERVAMNVKNPNTMEKATKGIGGAHFVFLDTYGVRPSDMVDILNEYRDKASL